MVTRVLDLAILFLLAVLILLPPPDVKAKPALRLPEERRGEVAELQADLARDPTNPERALALADLFLDGHRPDWALAVLTPPLAAHPSDHRLHLRRALALAEHFEAPLAYRAAARARELCAVGSSAPCDEVQRARIDLTARTLESVKGLDMRAEANTARQRILEVLRPSFIPRARGGASGGAAPATAGGGPAAP